MQPALVGLVDQPKHGIIKILPSLLNINRQGVVSIVIDFLGGFQSSLESLYGFAGKFACVDTLGQFDQVAQFGQVTLLKG